MPRRLNEQVVAKTAVVNSAGSAAGLPIAATKIDATGYSRARFIFQMSNVAGTGSLQTGFGVWKASTSGATFSLVTSGVANTSGAISGGANNIVVVDVQTDPAAPWLQVSGSFLNVTLPHGCVVELYSGINRPPTQAELQVVVI
jgi:hypothetical protein